MISKKPYLLRAYYDWIVENGWTPYILVHADEEGVDVPKEYVNQGRIILNVSPQ
ncbi:MAG: ClpXP protease specificity-enhancing factor SspB, partial [Legionellaceae bacterium]|nr:ClpXP protease specificity-enhancing factor SspB [Legionellaceae bacterium]